MTFEEKLEGLRERHEALTQSVELLLGETSDLRVVAEKDGDNIRALARVADIHERRLTDLEGGEPGR
jgi:hypothetical protein